MSQTLNWYRHPTEFKSATYRHGEASAAHFMTRLCLDIRDQRRASDPALAEMVEEGDQLHVFVR